MQIRMWQKRKLRASNKLSLDAGIVQSFAATAGLFFYYKSPRVSGGLRDSRQWAQGNRPAKYMPVLYLCAFIHGQGLQYLLTAFMR